MNISLSTTNQSHYGHWGKMNETKEKEREDRRQPENSKDVHCWGPRVGERMRLTTGAELKQFCEIQPRPEESALIILRDEMSEALSLREISWLWQRS
jgi:hypothetical protein